MKKYAFFLLLSLGVFVSCSKSESSDSDDADPITKVATLRKSKAPIVDNMNGIIPADVFMVGRINVQQIIDESGIENQRDRIGKLIKQQSKSNIKTFDFVMDNYKSAGVNLSRPVYFFIPEVSSYRDPEIFVVCELTSEDKMLTLLNKNKKGTRAFVERSDDGSLLYIGGDLVGGWRNKMAIFGKFHREEEVFKYLNVHDRDCYFSTNSGRYIKEQMSDLTCVINMNAMELTEEDLYKSKMPHVDMDMLRQYVAGINVDFADGEIIMSTNVLKGQINTYMGDQLSPDMLSFVPSNKFLGVIMTSIHGKKMADMLRSVLIANGADGDVANIVCGIVKRTDGTITMGVNGSNKDNISFFASVPVKESTIEKFVDDAYGNGVYSTVKLQGSEEDVEIKEKKGYTCVGYRQSVKEQENSIAARLRKKNMSHANMYMYVDAPAVMKFAASEKHIQIPKEVMNAFVSLEAMTTEKEGAVSLKLNTDQNALAFLLDLVLDFASK